MEFSNYIKELLFLNDCVILPGFGGFISKYKPAEFDASHLSFAPPAKELVFNTHIIHNDGLFINYVAVVNRISFREAKEIYSGFVNNLFYQLESGNTIVFNEIGTFKLDSKKNIAFEVDLSTNLLAEAYGLSSFNFPVVEQVDIPRQIEHEIRESGKIRKFLLHPISRAAIISVPVIASLIYLTIKTDIASTLKEKYFAVNEFIADSVKNFREYASKEAFNNPNSMEATLALQTNKYFALFYGESVKEINTTPEVKTVKPAITDSSAINATIETETKTAIESDTKTTPVKDEVKQSIAEKTKEQPKPIIKEDKKKETKAEIKVTAPQNKYYLVAGSFGNIDNAKAMSKQINSKGYNTEILVQKNGLYRVSVKSFADRNTAAGEQVAMNAKNTDFSVWILGGN